MLITERNGCPPGWVKSRQDPAFTGDAGKKREKLSPPEPAGTGRPEMRQTSSRTGYFSLEVDIEMISFSMLPGMPMFFMKAHFPASSKYNFILYISSRSTTFTMPRSL